MVRLVTPCGRGGGSDNTATLAVLNSILAALQAGTEQAQLLVMCALPATTPPTKVIVEAIYDADANLWAYALPNGASVAMGVDFESCMEGSAPPRVESGACRSATVGGSGYLVGDLLQEYLFWDTSVTPPSLIETQWRNVTQQTIMVSPPSVENTEDCSDSLDISALATSANQAVANVALSNILAALGDNATATNQATAIVELSKIVADLSDHATAPNQIATNSALANISSALGVISTDQTTGNTTLASILAALANDTTAANQVAGNGILASILSAINSQQTGDIELVCADGSPAFRSVNEAGSETFLDGTGVISPVFWVPGPCPVAPLDIGALATSANQAVSNVALSNILAALGDNATAANQVLLNTAISNLQSALQIQKDVEYISGCIDGIPGFKKIVHNWDGSENTTYWFGNGDNLGNQTTGGTFFPGPCYLRMPDSTVDTMSTQIVCADGSPVFRHIELDDNNNRVETFIGADGAVVTPTTWVPGACSQIEVSRQWLTSEVTEATGPVEYNAAPGDLYHGLTAVLIVEDPTTINYAADYGEHDGVRVPVQYSFGHEAVAGEVLSGSHTLRSFGSAKWVVKVKV